VETVVVAATPAASEPAEETKAPARFGGSVDDAELLDEESSDPEIQLDLARAYISMGDREAARVILDEVVNNGTEAQQAEARKMLAFL
jgi:pilus assembly protein FimV